MRGTFTYNGRSSSEFGILIDTHTSYRSANRDYTVKEVPGRNGDLTIDNGRWKNVEVSYKCGIGKNFAAKIDELRAWLMSNVGYKRLEDDWQDGYFRLARVKEAPNPQTLRSITGEFTVTFDCDPRRFLKTGETKQTFTGSGTISNPTNYEARPLIRVYGTGTLRIGGTTITITAANSYTDLDCDLQDAFRGTTNCNGNVRLDSGDFPVLAPGSNGVVPGSGISRVEITPRWWTI